MVEALVEFDYDAVNSDELTIKVGETISNIKTLEGGWWEGEVNGKRGMFPDNFVKIIDSNKNAVSAPPVNGQASTDEVIRRESNSQKKKMRAKVTYSYAPQNEDEIPLEVNAEIEVISQPEPGWWEGMVDGKKGMFPSNFVEMLPETEVEEVKPVRKKPQGPGFGNIFLQGPAKLKPVAQHPSPRQDSPSKPDTSSKSVRPLATKRDSLIKTIDKPLKPDHTSPTDHNAVKERALVEFDYDPKNMDELQLKKGTTINIISKDIGDKGWWRGEIDGRSGVFPDNFVKLLPPEAEQKGKVGPPGRPGAGPRVGEKRSSIDKPPPKEEKKLPGAKAVFPGVRAKPRVAAPETKPRPGPPAHQEGTNDFGPLKPINKLNHLTKDRPKVDNKRPPSSHGSVTENMRRLAMKRPSLPTTLEHVGYSESTDGPAPLTKNPAVSKSFTGSSSLTGGGHKQGGSATNGGASTAELEKLQTEMTNMKAYFKKEIDNLVQELDEEKKLRMSMQVEIERIRKKLMN